MARNNGTYLVTAELLVRDTYSLSVTLGGESVNESPYTVTFGEGELDPLKLQWSEYPTGQNEAGSPLVLKSKPRDSCGNILASPLPANSSVSDLISTEIQSKTGTIITPNSSLVFQLGHFSQNYVITQGGHYSGLMRGKQQGGLIASYFRSVDFLNPLELIDSYSHSPTLKYTKIDSILNYTLASDSGTSPLSNFQSYYYSTRWTGYIRNRMCNEWLL